MSKTNTMRHLMEASESYVSIPQVIQEHISRNIPLTDNLFRLGSDAYLEVFQEAKQMRANGVLPQMDEISEELLETDLGEYGDYQGERVPLDLPFIDENKTDQTVLNRYNWKLNKDDYMNALTEYIMLITQNALSHQDSISKITESYSNVSGESFIQFVDYLVDQNKLPHTLSATYAHLSEAEYKGKKVQLNKPKRGGSKSYYVYVKNPKTGNVIKVEFGSGMPAKINDPDRRKAYDSRHGCSDGKHNDKTKAGYWSCRLPRFADALGLSGSGQWW